MSTNGTTKPAILSAAEIEAMRAELSNFSTRPSRHKQIADAFLAHIDALTAGKVDEEALGRAAWERMAPPWLSLSVYDWHELPGEVAEYYKAIGSALYTLGRAAGRSEGEAERASLLQQHRIDRDALNGTESELDGARAEITRLTAGNVDEASRVALGRELIGADRPIPCPKCGKPVRLPDEATDGELSVGECLTCEEDVEVEATVVVAWNVA